MAAVLYAKLSGLEADSAGLYAAAASPASSGARSAVRNYGCTLEGHRSQTLTPGLVAKAQAVYCMTASQKAEVVSLWPEHSAKVRTLNEKRDVRDPFGGDDAEYRSVAEQIYVSVVDIIKTDKLKSRGGTKR
jgi:protein-tyrosine phosphatase